MTRVLRTIMEALSLTAMVAAPALARMRRCRLLRALVLAVTIATPCAAQSRADTVAVTNAFVQTVQRERRSPGGWRDVGAVFVDSGATTWGAFAAALLRDALPASTRPVSDTARYYALRATVVSLSIHGDEAEVRVEWSNCRRPQPRSHINYWSNPTRYKLRRRGDTWMANEGQVEAFLDGHCDAYPGR